MIKSKLKIVVFPHKNRLIIIFQSSQYSGEWFTLSMPIFLVNISDLMNSGIPSRDLSKDGFLAHSAPVPVWQSKPMKYELKLSVLAITNR